MNASPPRRTARGFTLVEILMVVAILGILASFVIPRYVGAQDQAEDSAIRHQLTVIREQVERFRLLNGTDPDMSDWSALLAVNYIKAEPINPLNDQRTINGVGDFTGGWVWRDDGTGTNQLYGTNSDNTGEFVE